MVPITVSSDLEGKDGVDQKCLPRDPTLLNIIRLCRVGGECPEWVLAL